MSTEFISFLPPPGDAIAHYNRHAHYDEQLASIPSTFTEAMSIREDVFVREQGVLLENELDADDPRSFHWVVYASVGTSAPPPKPTGGSDERRASGSTASRVAVGTIRLVPPPHPPHPAPGTEHKIDNTEALPSSPTRVDSKTTTPINEPTEPYIKLGRIATLGPYRGLGLSKLLVNAALNWASQHPEDIMPHLSPAELEAAKLEGKKEQEPWRGLVLVHAQTNIRKLWERFGFVIDKDMSTWDEEGIEHVSLWKRIEVKGVDSGLKAKPFPQM